MEMEKMLRGEVVKKCENFNPHGTRLDCKKYYHGGCIKENEIPKRYMLFGGTTYYASGGVNDLIYKANTVEKLVGIASQMGELNHEFEWWHVFDTVWQKVVAGTAGQAYGAPDLSEDDEDSLIVYTGEDE